MTRNEIEALTPDALTALLAERVMGWWFVAHVDSWDVGGRFRARKNWCPTTDRNDLAELLDRVDTLFMLREVHSELMAEHCRLNEDEKDKRFFGGWLLRCSPQTICRAIAVACCGGDDNG